MGRRIGGGVHSSRHWLDWTLVLILAVITGIAIRHGTMPGFSREQVRRIRELRASGMSYGRIRRMLRLSCSKDTIARVCIGQSYVDYPGPITPAGTIPNRTCSVLTEAEVRAIRARYAGGDVTQAALAEEYGVHYSTVSRIVNGSQWSRRTVPEHA